MNRHADREWVRPARQARSQDTRDRLLLAGAQLIERHGLDGARISDIAAAAGCSVGTFYFRFRDKQGLFLALQELFRERSAARVDALLAPERWQQRPLQEAAAALCSLLVSGFRENRGLLGAALRARMTDPAAWTPMRESAAHVARGFTALAVTHGDACAHPEPGLAAAFAVQMVLGTLVNATLNQPGPLGLDDPQLETELARMLNAYLGLGGRCPGA